MLAEAMATKEFQAALFVVETLRGRGFQAYFAGGCVRDLLLGALNSAGLAGRPPGATAAAVELLVMLPSVPS